MMQVLFIYNPVAGTGRVKKNLFEIVDFYNSNNCLITLCPIRKIDTFFEILDFERTKYDVVVCSGGDGTLNVMISFLKARNISIPIAYIPAGSTNDYAYSLGIPQDFDKALERTLTGEIKQIDIGQFNDKYFLYVAAFGVFTSVAYSTSQKVKNLLGHTAYILEGIRQLSELKSYHMVVETDDNVIYDSFILGLVTNSLSVGGIKNIMPNDVALDDGKFEVILIKMPQSIVELHGIITSLLGEKMDENENIIYCKTKKVKVTSDKELAWTLDGEYGGMQKEVDIVNLQEEGAVIV